MTLVIGNKNYSSWSLRPWLLLKQAEIAFEEIRIPLYTAESRARILAYSPSGKVPVLLDGDVKVWDSLAIAEYLAERFPEKQLWPEDAEARAQARSISGEMHSGFSNLRTHMSMNCRRHLPGKGRTSDVEREIGRIIEIWENCRARSREGPFLFGAFSIADAMYAPVVLRFQTYAVRLPPIASRYAQEILALPAIQQWLTQAKAETEIIAEFE
ncbi:MAG: glutathione S-transferase family protein [Burkholderiales bacterium]